MKISKDLEQNIQHLKSILKSEDITFLEEHIGHTKAMLVFVNDLVNKESLGELILRPASQFNDELDEKSFFQLFLSPEKKRIFDLNELVSEVVSGSAVLIADTLSVGISFKLFKSERNANRKSVCN